jgi:hypothetical protein
VRWMCFRSTALHLCTGAVRQKDRTGLQSVGLLLRLQAINDSFLSEVGSGREYKCG